MRMVYEGRLVGASCLDADTGLSPVPPLCVVSVAIQLVLCFPIVCSFGACNAHEGLSNPTQWWEQPVVKSEEISYLMVLPVRRRIHCGIGLFCFWALANLTFVRKDLWLCRWL